MVVVAQQHLWLAFVLVLKSISCKSFLNFYDEDYQMAAIVVSLMSVVKVCNLLLKTLPCSVLKCQTLFFCLLFLLVSCSNRSLHFINISFNTSLRSSYYVNILCAFTCICKIKGLKMLLSTSFCLSGYYFCVSWIEFSVHDSRFV